MSGRMNSTDGTDELRRDMELAEALTVIDPASQDPNYWLRFRAWVMSNAARELARRRLIVQLTVGDVMEAWARALVPAAVLAAMLAGLLLLRGGTLNDPPPIGIEELLVSEVEGETIPDMLAREEASEFVATFAEIF